MHLLSHQHRDAVDGMIPYSAENNRFYASTQTQAALGAMKKYNPSLDYLAEVVRDDGGKIKKRLPRDIRKIEEEPSSTIKLGSGVTAHFIPTDHLNGSGAWQVTTPDGPITYTGDLGSGAVTQAAIQELAKKPSLLTIFDATGAGQYAQRGDITTADLAQKYTDIFIKKPGNSIIMSPAGHVDRLLQMGAAAKATGKLSLISLKDFLFLDASGITPDFDYHVYLPRGIKEAKDLKLALRSLAFNQDGSLKKGIVPFTEMVSEFQTTDAVLHTARKEDLKQLRKQGQNIAQTQRVNSETGKTEAVPTNLILSNYIKDTGTNYSVRYIARALRINPADILVQRIFDHLNHDELKECLAAIAGKGMAIPVHTSDVGAANLLLQQLGIPHLPVLRRIPYTFTASKLTPNLQ